MLRPLPPLNALRAFEAAARHLSFTKAAQELFVTQAAVSHQIKSLEDHLGIQLFRRMNRRLILTDEAQILLPAVSKAFDIIKSTTQKLYDGGDRGALKVSVMPSFAAKWLLPRLPKFRRLHPEIDILVSATISKVNFNRDDVDMAIRFGSGQYPGLQVDQMMKDESLVVCSPHLLKGPLPLRSPEDLKYHTLLHDDVGEEPFAVNWRRWLQLAGVTGVDPNRGPGYSDSSLILQAAIEGQGVALGRTSLTYDDLKAGRLVCPFGPRAPANYQYYVVSPYSTSEITKIRVFREWLLSEAKADDFVPNIEVDLDRARERKLLSSGETS
ncbi:transcriptional regulator GcvA [Kiloniella laminariae]|uniref:Transcriptional regulator GcvA n=1 Tax=Kiloniella laminariae TaxID=454162 RepID=A0ABT4LHK8_9PROT|nr:transcriptional regulator GcvA [Kiloniella laminariae]MCZ4280585.1 transcriptional regulator GcvA [Kiloniella laminariae]